MQRKEPSTRLVNTLVDEVTGEGCAVVNEFLVFKGIVLLGVWHRAAVEPHVYEVALALHRLATLADQDDVIDIRTVQVNLVVVLFRHVTRHKAILLQRIVLHDASLDGFLDFIVQFLDRADANLLTVLRAPDGQRCTPETATAEVPVVQVVEPVAEASRSC